MGNSLSAIMYKPPKSCTLTSSVPAQSAGGWLRTVIKFAWAWQCYQVVMGPDCPWSDLVGTNGTVDQMYSHPAGTDACALDTRDVTAAFYLLTMAAQCRPRSPVPPSRWHFGGFVTALERAQRISGRTKRVRMSESAARSVL